MLDTLRAARKLPEEQDFRQWKQQLHEAYRAVEPKEHMWHLPDGRTLRVVTTPNPEGGVTYLFDDVTERLDMEPPLRRADPGAGRDARQSGRGGRGVRQRRPRAAAQSGLPAHVEADAGRRSTERPHIEAVTAWCQALHDDDALWRSLRAAVTAIDGREPIVGAHRTARRQGDRLDHRAAARRRDAGHLPRRDRHASTSSARCASATRRWRRPTRIKIDFVHHVSYELRSPLTNIIGFAHLLGDPAFGPLSDKQREYLGYITTSTNALLAIINNILDLATIDAGAMTLNLGEVDIRASMEAAAEGVQDRLVKDNITLDIRAAAGIGSFTADERRLRQILFNLLSNAVGFSPPGETITLAAERRAGRGGVHRHRPRPRHPAGGAGQGVRLVRDRSARLAASRRRARAVARALLRRTARRHGDASIRCPVEHHGHLRIPGRARGKAERGLANKCPPSAGAAGRAVSLGVAREILL